MPTPVPHLPTWQPDSPPPLAHVYPKQTREPCRLIYSVPLQKAEDEEARTRGTSIGNNSYP